MIDPIFQRAVDAQDRRDARKMAKREYRQERARDGKDLDAWASHLLGERKAPPATGFGSRGRVRGVAGIAKYQRS